MDFIRLTWSLPEAGLMPKQAGCGEAKAKVDDTPARKIPEMKFDFLFTIVVQTC